MHYFWTRLNGLATAAMLLLAASLPQAVAFDLSPDAPGRKSLSVEVTRQPVFPPGALHDGRTSGRVDLALSVDGEGRLSDRLVLGYSHPAFVQALDQVIEHWNFLPARVDGEPIASRAELEIRFSTSGAVLSLSVTEMAQRFIDRREHYIHTLVPVAQLDAPPAIQSSQNPVYPESLREAGIHGRVDVEFFIDREGAVRLPAVLAAEHLELAALAVEAVQNWRFAPPLRNGRPAATRVRQSFRFGEDLP